MLTAFSQRELVDRASQAGAMAYVVKPFGKADLIPAIEIARARFAEIQAVEAEVSDLTERLESRKAVDRAKGLLQTGLGLTEPEAFRWIQKTAMDLRKSMREVAEGVIEHGVGAARRSSVRPDSSPTFIRVTNWQHEVETLTSTRALDVGCVMLATLLRTASAPLRASARAASTGGTRA